MNFINDEIINYANDHSESEPILLKNLYRETNLEVLNPRMISSPLQGRLLSFLSKLINPKNILEIGTYTGYSALCLCEGLKKNGVIHTIDKNEELSKIQKKYFNRSIFKSQIIQHVGNAKNIIPKLNIDFDLIFIDADKENYIKYFDLVVPKLKSGGLLITDNVLWSGKVLSEDNDNETKIIKKYNTLIKNDPRLKSLMLPIRDGLTLSLKN
jgi:caffeoyl-CoA O-methyltransferase